MENVIMVIDRFFKHTALASLRQKHLLTLAALALLCLSSAAQNTVEEQKRLKHDISVGFGYAVLMSLEDWSDKEDNWNTPTLHLQYMYDVNQYVSLGVMFDYANSSWSETSRVLQQKYNENNRFIGQDIVNLTEKESTDWFTFSPTVRVYWFHRNHFSMYSRMSLGVLKANGHDSGTYMMPTFSPIALEVGGSHWRLFSEPGSIGSLGLFNAGLIYSF